MIFCYFCKKQIFVISKNQKVYFQCNECLPLEVTRSSDNEKISYLKAVYASIKDIKISKEIFIENEKETQKKLSDLHLIYSTTLKEQKMNFERDREKQREEQREKNKLDREEQREKDKLDREEAANLFEIYKKIHDYITLKNMDSNLLDELKKEYDRIFIKLSHNNSQFYPDIQTICNGFENDGLPRLLETYLKEQNDNDNNHISKNIGCRRYFTVRHQHHNLDEFSVNIIKNKYENETASNYLSYLMYQKITVVMPEHNDEKFLIVPVPNSLLKSHDCCGVSLAKKLSTNLRKPLCLDVLKKNKNLDDRKYNKTYEERRIMAEQNYIINNCKPIKNKKILLVDDLYWGGSTMNKCAQLLIQNGARHVMCFSAGTRD